MSGFLWLFVFIFIGWAWYNQLQAREKALRVAHEFCNQQNVQFLDESVVLKKIRLKKENGVLRLYRLFRFDYHFREKRLHGTIELLGMQVLSKTLGIEQARLENIYPTAIYPSKEYKVSNNVVDFQNARKKRKKN